MILWLQQGEVPFFQSEGDEMKVHPGVKPSGMGGGGQHLKPRHAIFLLSMCGLSSITAEAVSETPSTAARSLYAVNKSGTDRGSISIYDIDAGHQLIKTVETVSHVGDVRGIVVSAVTGKLYVAYRDVSGVGWSTA